MGPTRWLLLVGAVAVAIYGLLVLALVLAGRRGSARALVGFLPDCLVLVRRLLGDPRVPRRHKLVLAATAAYLAFPLDVIPDVPPVVGQLDDALVLAIALRAVLRGGGGPALVEEHWPGPASSLAIVLRLAGRDAQPVASTRSSMSSSFSTIASVSTKG